MTGKERVSLRPFFVDTATNVSGSGFEGKMSRLASSNQQRQLLARALGLRHTRRRLVDLPDRLSWPVLNEEVPQ
jgi:hypothetical protein